jgi:hypothetical protein
MNETGLSTIEFEKIKENIRNLLLSGPKHLYEIVPLAGNYDEEKILTVIQWLLDNRSILRRSDEKLQLSDELPLV